MRILVYGAGNIGSLYAGFLARPGYDASILARGKRLASIRDHGIELEEFRTRQSFTALPTVTERLAPDDAYDLIIVALGREHVDEVVPILAQNRVVQNVLFFGNRVVGPDALVEALGRDRVLLGFPGAAGIPAGQAIRYVILSAREQPTTLGEIDESLSPRLEAIAAALRHAGFPVATSRHIDAWLKTHAAEIVPTACALYMAAGDAKRLARTRDALVLMVRAVREGYRVLRANGVPIVPRGHSAFRWIPEPILIAIIRRMLSDESFAVKLGHGLAARSEMALLASDLARLAETAAVEIPASTRLVQYIDSRVAPIADASAELRLKWRPA